VEDLDVLDGTPLLDLKPYVPEFDHRPDVRLGWLEDVNERARSTTSDDRFS
ncbi:MAG TPA: tRNA (N6-threonylcarbamoyladenosine(37)-N6)-methyltransferase TrmO, partial [Chloroflexi bacterium]|nr:tRNA (N6-threonylcarbamoyladenosine(37)-N6)-methyltransferase TrmO [Chloroflexota bacterium]